MLLCCVSSCVLPWEKALLVKGSSSIFYSVYGVHLELNLLLEFGGYGVDYYKGVFCNKL